MDVTEHPTGDGKVFVAVVLDAFSRMVVGWSIADHIGAERSARGYASRTCWDQWARSATATTSASRSGRVTRRRRVRASPG
jgi:transposase InsO family protein